MNPLNFNYEYIDNERPIIRGLYVIDEEDKLSFSLPEQVKISKLNDSVYIGNDIIYNGSIGFGIDIYDIQYKNLFNRNGIYEIELLIDSLPLFSYKMDEINFSENHFKKLMYDYKSLVENNKRVLKVFTPPNSDLSFLKNNSFNGIIDPREVKESFVTIKVSDRNRNSSYLNFNIKYEDTIKKKLAYDGIEILKNQKYDDIIPKYLPKSVEVAHKDGWISGVRHDSGIIFLENNKKYVLVLLSKKLENEIICPSG